MTFNIRWRASKATWQWQVEFVLPAARVQQMCNIDVRHGPDMSLGSSRQSNFVLSSRRTVSTACKHE